MTFKVLHYLVSTSLSNVLSLFSPFTSSLHCSSIFWKPLFSLTPFVHAVLSAWNIPQPSASFSLISQVLYTLSQSPHSLHFNRTHHKPVAVAGVRKQNHVFHSHTLACSQGKPWKGFDAQRMCAESMSEQRKEKRQGTEQESQNTAGTGKPLAGGAWRGECTENTQR